jgi:hypothetical protein
MTRTRARRARASMVRKKGKPRARTRTRMVRNHGHNRRHLCLHGRRPLLSRRTTDRGPRTLISFELISCCFDVFCAIQCMTMTLHFLCAVAVKNVLRLAAVVS